MVAQAERGNTRPAQDSPNRPDLTALVCAQGVEELRAEVTYHDDPHLDRISRDSLCGFSPMDPAQRLRNGTIASSGAAAPPPPHFNVSALTADWWTEFPHQKKSYGNIDSFFYQLIERSDGTRFQDLTGPGNVQTLIGAVTRGYQEVLAYILDQNLRPQTPPSPLAAGPVAISNDEGREKQQQRRGGEGGGTARSVGGFAKYHVRRLAIHEPSNLFLQALLGCMAVLGLAAYGSVRLRSVLLRAPYTIASVMGFLEGSQLCDPDVVTLPAGLGLMSYRELRAAFDGWLFSLSWWARDGGGGEKPGPGEGASEQTHHNKRKAENSSTALLENKGVRGRFREEMGGPFDDSESTTTATTMVADGVPAPGEDGRRRARFVIDIGTASSLGFSDDARLRIRRRGRDSGSFRA